MRKDYEFSEARRAKDVPHLSRLRAEATGKTRITIMLDNIVIETFRAQAQAQGVGYQTLINKALREHLGEEPVTVEAIRRVLREELSGRG